MARKTNQDKGKPDPELEAVLAQTPPDINEPQGHEDDDINDGLNDDEHNIEEEEEKEVVIEEELVLKSSEPAPEPLPSPPVQVTEPTKPVVIPEPEPIEVKEVVAPTDEELRAYVLQDGVDIDELTNFEKATAKRNYMIEKRQEAINDSFKTQRQQSAWSKKIDSFIEGVNDDPKFVQLGGHEAEFKKFALQHPESDIQTLLLPAFLHQLPPTVKKSGSLFVKGGGGEKAQPPKTVVDDADLVAKLRISDPREYKRQLRAGKIKLEVD